VDLNRLPNPVVQYPLFRGKIRVPEELVKRIDLANVRKQLESIELIVTEC